jgi:hypothetical protein
VGKLLEESGIAASQNDVIYLHGVLEQFDNLLDVMAPFSSAQALESGQSNVIFVASTLLLRKVRQLHRLEDTVNDQRGAKTRS